MLRNLSKNSKIENSIKYFRKFIFVQILTCVAMTVCKLAEAKNTFVDLHWRWGGDLVLHEGSILLVVILQRSISSFLM